MIQWTDTWAYRSSQITPCNYSNTLHDPEIDHKFYSSTVYLCIFQKSFLTPTALLHSGTSSPNALGVWQRWRMVSLITLQEICSSFRLCRKTNIQRTHEYDYKRIAEDRRQKNIDNHCPLSVNHFLFTWGGFKYFCYLIGLCETRLLENPRITQPPQVNKNWFTLSEHTLWTDTWPPPQVNKKWFTLPPYTRTPFFYGSPRTMHPHHAPI